MGFAAQAESLDAPGLAALAEPVEYSEFAALVKSVGKNGVRRPGRLLCVFLTSQCTRKNKDFGVRRPG